ncbi:MAG: YceI family protein [Pseudomonadota bacterium]
MAKQSIWMTCALLAVAVTGGQAQAETSGWQLVADSSTVRFIGVQSGSGFRGRFRNFTAEIDFDPATPEAGRIVGVVGMDSARTGDAERDATLLEADWFDPENHPESRFESQRIEKLDDGTYAAHGTLTIIGNSNPVTMNFEFDVSGSTAEFSGSFDILRLDYGVGWDSTNWIDNEVGVQVELELTK